MRNRLDNAIEKREKRIDKHGFEIDKFTLKMLEKAKEHHDGEKMMVEEVKAIEDAAIALHRLVTADVLPFESLEACEDNCIVVQDERHEMLKVDQSER